MDAAIGSIIGIVSVGAVAVLIYSLTLGDNPCRQHRVEYRQVLIEAHEQCMTEENCIYKDWDIRKYDNRLETQAMCEANNNDDD